MWVIQPALNLARVLRVQRFSGLATQKARCLRCGLAASPHGHAFVLAARSERWGPGRAMGKAGRRGAGIGLESAKSGVACYY